MKKNFLFLLGAMLLFSFQACNTNASEEKKNQDKTAPIIEAKYICPMKCEGSGSDVPGKCPVCDMDLVEAASLHKATHKSDSHPSENQTH